MVGARGGTAFRMADSAGSALDWMIISGYLYIGLVSHTMFHQETRKVIRHIGGCWSPGGFTLKTGLEY
jgi:uncharacterized protein YijF (DUF1287 family)